MKGPSDRVVLTVIGCIAVVVICVCSLGMEYGWFSHYEPVAEKMDTLSQASTASKTGKYNLNTVTADELAGLPGVGETLAGRILAFRYQNGGFQSLDQLLLVEGMNERIFSEILPYITV